MTDTNFLDRMPDEECRVRFASADAAIGLHALPTFQGSGNRPQRLFFEKYFPAGHIAIVAASYTLHLALEQHASRDAIFAAIDGYEHAWVGAHMAYRDHVRREVGPFVELVHGGAA